MLHWAAFSATYKCQNPFACEELAALHISKKKTQKNKAMLFHSQRNKSQICANELILPIITGEWALLYGTVDFAVPGWEKGLDVIVDTCGHRLVLCSRAKME